MKKIFLTLALLVLLAATGWLLLRPAVSVAQDIPEGVTDGNDADRITPCDVMIGGNVANCSCGGNGSLRMARYSAHAMDVSLNIVDTPLFYTPARGPAVNCIVTYNQRDGDAPTATPTPTPVPTPTPFTHLGPKWTLNWVSYLEDSPGTTGNIKLYAQGGGRETYAYNSTTQFWILVSGGGYSHAYIERLTSDPNKYKRHLPDGSEELFGYYVSTSAGRKVFLTKITDPVDHSLTFTYTNSNLTTVTDDIGQTTTLHYDAPGDSHRLTSVEVDDSFTPHRSTNFAYYSDGRLQTITDMGGLTSTFTYGTTPARANFITSLVTPYGASTFDFGDATTDPSLAANQRRWLEMTDPNGGKERLEFRHEAPIDDSEASGNLPENLTVTNQYLKHRNTFYWSKKAMTEVSTACNTSVANCGASDYAQARITHWLHTTDNKASGMKESEKAARENRIWYTYVGQSGGTFRVGTESYPQDVARRLETGVDNTTQRYQYVYNTKGNITQVTDPSLRITKSTYKDNGIDLLTVSQKISASQDDLLAEYNYDGSPPHMPAWYKDAARQRTDYSYYSNQGQLQTITNPKGEVTRFTYYLNGPHIGALQTITANNQGSLAAPVDFTYDDHGRVSSITGPPDEANHRYNVSIEYTALNQVRKITYPDTTFEEITYDRLDPEWVRDRMGRLTHNTFDALQHLRFVEDPEHRITEYKWCNCGLLDFIKDANLNATTFEYDVQSRMTKKTYQDTHFDQYVYEDATSRLKSMIDAKNQTTNYLYYVDDNLNQVSYTNAQFPTPTVKYTYDPKYDRITMLETVGLGTLNYTYKPIGQQGATKLETVGGFWGANAHDTIRYDYDELGRLWRQKINDGTNDHASTVDFDALGRVRLSTNDLATNGFTRDYDGKTPRLQALTHPSPNPGLTASYAYASYPADPRLETLANKKGTTTLSQFTYGYYADGQIATLSKNLGGTVTNSSFLYDDSQWLYSIEQGSQEFGYTYDAVGNRLADYFSGPPSPSSSRTYAVNVLNQLSSVTIDSGLGPPQGPFPITYDANGNLTEDYQHNKYYWDAANRLARIDYADNSRTDFKYDGLGRRVRIDEYGPPLVAEIEPKDGGFNEFATEPIDLPDGNYQITFEGVNPNGGNNTALIDMVTLESQLVDNGGFEMPEVGADEESPEESGWTWTDTAGIASVRGEIMSDGPGTPEGSQAAYIANYGAVSKSGTVTPGKYGLSFQAMQQPSGNDSSQILRVSVRTVPSNKTFLWSGSTLAEERDQTGTTVKKRFFAEGQTSVNGATTTKYFYTRDHLGSIREVTNSNGDVVARYDYDAWGKQVAFPGSNITASDFGYTGHYVHGPSGLNLSLYRAYNPSIGRWISRDPLGEASGINLYGYALNDPTRNIDRLGLAAQEIDEPFPGESGNLGTLHGDDVVNRAPNIVTGEILEGAGTVIAAIVPVERIISLIPGVANLVQFGRVPNQIFHTFRHVDQAGLCREAVADAIAAQLGRLGAEIPIGTGETITVIVNGQTVIAKAYRLENGVINVGRIVVKP